MELNTVQHDALVELLNIGFGRAGASLSKLTQQRVLLEVPQVAIHPVTHLNQALGRLVDERVASVHQVFSGPVAGDALLLLDPIAAATLTELLTDVPPLSMDLDPSAREVFTEVGNIVLNACIGTFGNMLGVPVSFSVPDVDVTSVHSVIDRMLDSGEAFRYALVITAGFRLRDSAVTGYVVIVLTVQSLKRLLDALDRWQQIQA
ncbi:MAG: chemotaxis protein CheC [Cyanobacteria bacterium]|nr:chemotaxis protein CheC [Cyanobacteriota bacterium]